MAAAPARRNRTAICLLGGALACAPAGGSAGPAAPGQEVDSALARYGRFTMQMASDSLAAFFTPDGQLVAEGQPPIVGPAAILTHLRSFNDYRVLGDSLVADSTVADSATGLQVGHYWQRVRVPKGDTIEVRGGFEARWVRVAPHVWRLQRLATRR
ncbi:MAG TPA: nuclear transport factor 2 family protein [Gemmatimonadaceae bacterium]|nr:nuclear transport factor 2 family protein [Gemmatimonadaceae bacterium]